MKRIILTMALLLIMGSVRAETLTFAGLNYDDEVALAMGVGVPMFNTAMGEVWQFSYVNFGLKTYKSLTSEFAIIRGSDKSNLYGGLLLGGNGEWIGGENPTTYIVGASGIIGGYKNYYGYAKYKFALEGGTLYPDGLAFGFGAHVNF